MNKFIRKIGLILVCVMILTMFTGCIAATLGNLSNNVDKSKLQYDKSALAELRQSIIVALSDEKHMNAEASESGAKVSSDGKLEIADLFDEENDYGMAEAVSSVMKSDSMTLKSNMTKNCTIKIYMNGKTGNVVLQVESEEYTYYLDKSGEHEGIYNGDITE